MPGQGEPIIKEGDAHNAARVHAMASACESSPLFKITNRKLAKCPKIINQPG
jgi:hypothetical protein